MSQSKVGNKIRSLRKSKNLTQEQLGDALGVSMQAVSKWECGSNPDIDMLIKLAKYFSVTTDSLLGLKSNNADDIEATLFEDINSTHPNYQLEKACRYCWSMFKAMSAMPALKDDEYCKVPPDDMICSQSRVTLEKGLASMSAIEDFHYFIVMPEPEDGYTVALSDIDTYTAFFKRLSDPKKLKMLSYLYSLESTLFSAKKAANDLDLDINCIKDILIEFEEVDWIFKESATLSEYDVDLYRPNNTSAFIPLLRFATEMIKMPNLFYISYIERKTPFLRDMLKW